MFEQSDIIIDLNLDVIDIARGLPDMHIQQQLGDSKSIRKIAIVLQCATRKWHLSDKYRHRLSREIHF